ncbi:hypothetical protein C0J52_23128 [Blattella germanica]|nr:hypothetical protein C0J52_23128 [Blattella germanica]
MCGREKIIFRGMFSSTPKIKVVLLRNYGLCFMSEAYKITSNNFIKFRDDMVFDILFYME